MKKAIAIWLCAMMLGTMLVGNAINSNSAIGTAILPGTESDPSLGGQWNFSEGTGNTVYDTSGNNNDGTLMPNFAGGNAPIWVNGISGKALRFDGNDDYVTIPSSPSLRPTDAITMEAWIFSTSWDSPTNAPIIDKYWDGLNRGYYLWTDTGGEVRAVISNSLGAEQLNMITTNMDMQLNTWYHVAATWDKTEGNLKFYKNGALIETLGSGGTDSMIGNNMPVYIGADYGVEDNFKGAIDEVRIWSRALSQAELLDHYTTTWQNYLENESVEGRWHLDEGAGLYAYDASGNGNTGTLVNSPSWSANGVTHGAIHFDGVDDIIDCGADASLDPTAAASIGAWVKFDTLPSTAGRVFHIAGRSGLTTDLDLIGNTNNKFGFYIGAGKFAESTTTIKVGLWYHVTGTYLANNYVRIFVNGTLEQNTPIIVTRTNNPNDFTIGGSAYWGDRRFQGTIDEVGVWERALPYNEISNYYNTTWQNYLENESLEGQWKFDEVSGGTAFDTSENNNDGVLTPASLPRVAGISGNALDFNGANNYVLIGDPADGTLDFGATTDFTIGAWVRTDTTGIPQDIFDKRGGGSNWGYFMGIGADNSVHLLVKDIGGNTVESASSTVLMPNKWYHVMGVFDRDDTSSIYINGALDGTPLGISSVGNLDQVGDAVIGYRNPSIVSSWGYFNGLIDEVSAWSRALDSTEILDQFNAFAPVHNVDSDEYFMTIQAAIDDAQTLAGHTITVDAGTYNEKLTVNKRLTIQGAGMGNTTINGGGSGNVVTITANWVNVSGFKITGSGVAGTFPLYDAGIRLTGMNDCTISYNNITGNWNGMSISAGGRHTISHNQIRTSSYDGIYAGSSTFNRIDNNTIIGFTDSGIWLQASSSNGVIDNNTISTGPYGLYISSGSTSNTVIKWNTITKTTGQGMYLSGSTGSKITWNQVRSNTGIGITLSGSSSNSLMNNTLLWNNGTAGVALEGGAANNIVSYNNFWNNIRNGIRFASSGSGNRVIYNNFTNNAKSGIVYDAAIHLFQNSDYNIIANNSLFDNRYGLSGGIGCDYNVFDNNTVTYTLAYGIILGYSNYNTFKYNTVRNGLSGGAASGNAESNVFIRNNISSNTGNGIAIGQGGKHKILNNTITHNGASGINITGSAGGQNTPLIHIDGNNVSFNGWNGIALWDQTTWTYHVYQTTVSNNIVIGNTRTGIDLAGSTYKNILRGNNVTGNQMQGISLRNAPDTTVTNNTVSENTMYGIYVSETSSSKIYHNNIIDNANQAFEDGDNMWNLAYSGGGNYWSDLTSPDDYGGPDQNIAGADGFVDVPRTIPGGANQDSYPWTTMNGWIGYTPTTGPVINTDTGEFFFLIQEAINDPDTQNGHTITVAAGMYFENLVVNKRLTIIGDGAGVTTIRGGGTGDVVTITSSWVNITGFKITNGGSAGDSAGVRFSTVQYCNVSACNVTGNLKHGIFVNSGSGNTIYGSTISASAANGIFLSNSPSNKIIGNTIEGNLGPEGGVYLYFASQTVISYNTIRNHPQSGIMGYYADYNQISWNTLTNNSKATSGYVYRSGIHLYQYSDYNKINNNTLFDNRIGLGTQYSITFNTWDNNTVSYSTSSGMILSYASYNYLKYNTFHHNAGSGISSGNSDLNTISRNNVFSNTGDGISISVGRHKIHNNTVTNNGFSGINVTGNSGSGATPSCYLDANNVSYNKRDGITLWDSTSWSYHVYFINVTNNVAYGNNRTGINLVGGTYTNTIRGNIVKGNLWYGVGLNNAPNCRIFNNTIEGNLNHGLYVISTSNSRIYHNNIIENTIQAYDSGTANRWNATYPNGGNYWSDYVGIDAFSGADQDIPGSDGFGDTPRAVNSAQDNYPLMFQSVWWAEVAPTITLVSPADGSVIQSGTTLNFYVWDGDFNLDSATYSVNAGASNPFGVNYDIGTAGWAEGDYSIQIDAQDKLGNTAQETFNFRIDDTNPTFTASLSMSIDAGADGFVDTGDTLTIWVNVTDLNEDAASAPVITVNEADFPGQAVSGLGYLGAGVWVCNYTVQAGGFNISDIDVTAPDKAGNTASQAGALTFRINGQKGIAFTAGWNLVSLPMDRPTINGVLIRKASDLANQTAVVMVSKWNPATQRYTSYIPGFHLPADPENFVIGPDDAIFIFTSADDVLAASGYRSVGQRSVDLSPGWNLVGYHCVDEGDVGTDWAAQVSCGIYDDICHWDGTTFTHYIFTGTDMPLVPGRGYFVWSDIATTLVY